MNTDEREQPTIKTGGESLSIFEIMQRYRNDGSCEYVIQDALRHFALLDSQAAECNAADWAIERVQSEYLRGRTEGAASMRSRCVEKVDQVRRNHGISKNQDYEYGFSDALNCVETALKGSPALDQVEQEKR